MERSKKISKKLAVGLVLLIGAVVVTSGVLMAYYFQGTADTDAQVILEWSEDDKSSWENAEDLVKSWDVGTDFVGGDTETFDGRWMKYNSDADNNLVVKFEFTDTGTDDAAGVYIKLEYNNSGTWTQICNETTSGTHEFTAGDEVELKITVVGDTYLEEGDYQYTLDITRNVAYP